MLSNRSQSRSTCPSAKTEFEKPFLEGTITTLAEAKKCEEQIKTSPTGIIVTISPQNEVRARTVQYSGAVSHSATPVKNYFVSLTTSTALAAEIVAPSLPHIEAPETVFDQVIEDDAFSKPAEFEDGRDSGIDVREIATPVDQKVSLEEEVSECLKGIVGKIVGQLDNGSSAEPASKPDLRKTIKDYKYHPYECPGPTKWLPTNL